MPKKVQYKLWVHMEKWVNGEPEIMGDEDPRSVVVPGNEEGLFDSEEAARSAQDIACEVLLSSMEMQKE